MEPVSGAWNISIKENIRKTSEKKKRIIDKSFSSVNGYRGIQIKDAKENKKNSA